MLGRIFKATSMPFGIAAAAVAALARFGATKRDKDKLPGGKYTPLGKRDSSPAVQPSQGRTYNYTSAPHSSRSHSHSDSSSSSSSYGSGLTTGLILGELFSSSSDSYSSTDYSSSSSDSFSGGGGDFGGGGSSDSY